MQVETAPGAHGDEGFSRRTLVGVFAGAAGLLTLGKWGTLAAPSTERAAARVKSPTTNWVRVRGPRYPHMAESATDRKET